MGEGVRLIETFVTPEEYPAYFASLGGLRGRVVEDLLPAIGGRPRVLDVPTGYGFFAIELARRLPGARLVGIDIGLGDVARARDKAAQAGLGDRIEVLQMDAAAMTFADGAFDLATSFLGFEDIHMTRGRAGVERAVAGIARVLRPGGLWCLTAMPPEEMETPAQHLEVALFSELCGSTWLGAAEYEMIWRRAGLDLVARYSYRTGKKLSPAQAREEIEFACSNVPALYGVPALSFEEVWGRYGAAIERHGTGHYSKVVCFHLRRG